MRFVRFACRQGTGREDFQWHRVGVTQVSAESDRLLIRPLRGLQHVSAIQMRMNGARIFVPRMRIVDVSGAVIEHHPQREIEPQEHPDSLILLDEELEVTGVEVIYQWRGETGRLQPTLEIMGGIALRQSPERNCLEALASARRELARNNLSRSRQLLDRARNALRSL